MELEFDVHVDANALYDYMLRHTFTKAAGILGSTAGALGIVAGMMQRYPIYVIFGAVVLLYQPVSLWLRAQKQALLPVFKEPLHYKMTEEGVEVSHAWADSLALRGRWRNRAARQTRFPQAKA